MKDADRESGRIEDGIEWFDDMYGGECACARCGSSAEFACCWKCGGEGLDGHDCGEDCCACLHPEENVECDACGGSGGRWRCLSTPEWCEANPRPGREHIPSTAMRAEAWDD